MSAASEGTDQTAAIAPGRFTRATIHSPAGELEARLSEGGNWELRIKSDLDQTWRFVCDGDMSSGASLASMAASAEESVRLGSLIVDRASHTASIDDEELPLSRKEFTLLAMLATQPNRVFTKTELLRAIWGYRNSTSTRTLDSHASRLRSKLRAAGADGVIVNTWGVGYRFWNTPELLAMPAPASAA